MQTAVLGADLEYLKLLPVLCATNFLHRFIDAIIEEDVEGVRVNEEDLDHVRVEVAYQPENVERRCSRGRG